jgi:hypothetical protein
MKNSIVAILTAAAIWTGIWPAVSAENSIVGTWLLTSFSLTVLDTKETSHPYGDHPTGYIQYTAGGHMVMFLTAGELKPPAAGSYTDTERADVHRAIVGAYAGTYVANPVLPKRLQNETPEAWMQRRAKILDDLRKGNDPLVYAQEHLAEFVDWAGVGFFARDKLLVDNQPVPFPRHCECVFAVIDTASKTGTEHDDSRDFFCI